MGCQVGVWRERRRPWNGKIQGAAVIFARDSMLTNDLGTGNFMRSSKAYCAACSSGDAMAHSKNVRAVMEHRRTAKTGQYSSFGARLSRHWTRDRCGPRDRSSEFHTTAMIMK